MKKFLILATPADEQGTIYQMTQVEVQAKNWNEAYNKLRNEGYKLLIDEYQNYV
jgi:hypothetical protein